ncbi:MAG: HAMP domain-containing protein [Candidatus Riflebacteria bacterium]|nr:HAMP domain-containing protein [Candidatus Riflebacteria bacterium]
MQQSKSDPEEISLKDIPFYGTKLFGRMFFWFCATAVLVILASFSVSYVFELGPFSRHFEQLGKEFARSHGQLMADILEEYGNSHLMDIKMLIGRRFLWIFSSEGKLLLQPDFRAYSAAFPSSLPPGLSIESFENGKFDEDFLLPEVRSFLAQKGEKESEVFSKGEKFFLQHVTAASGTPFIIAHMSPEKGFRSIVTNPFGHILLGAFLLITGILCFFLARSLAQPVLALRRMSRCFAAGNLSARVSRDVLERRDELGDLSRDFNFMAERLEVTLNRQQQLLRDISHELRSPLARMQVALEIAEKRADAHSLELIPRISLEVSRLEHLIQEVLTLFRLDDRESPCERVPVVLEKLIDTVISDARFEAGNASERIQWSSPPEKQTQILAPQDLIGRAIENVLRNAMKYSPADTSIEVTLTIQHEPLPKTASIRVSDRGPGVPPEKLNHLFEPFFRCQEDRSRSSGGAGLGLAIARRAVETIGGKVTAANRDGGGLQVEFVLPLNDL